jgi:hypothetical protein
MGKIRTKPLAKLSEWQQFIRQIHVAEICCRYVVDFAGPKA